MTTAAPQQPPPQQQHRHHHDHPAPRPQPLVSAETFDPDDVVPRDSPLMKPLRPKLEPSPSPPPDIPPTQVSLSSPRHRTPCNSNRPKIRNVSGDAVLIASLDNGRCPDLARAATVQVMSSNGENDQCQNQLSASFSVEDGNPVPTASARSTSISSIADTATPNLQDLAADALHAASAKKTSLPPLPKEMPDISTSTRQLSICSEGQNKTQPSGTGTQPPLVRKTSSSLTLSSTGGPLPPLQMDSPLSESNGHHSLPSIRSTFDDLVRLTAEKDGTSPSILPGTSPFSRSPPFGRPRLPPISASHVSPPISPCDAYPRSLPSPHSLPASSPFACYQPSGPGHRPSLDQNNSGAAETPSTEHSSSTPATSASVADRMSIDGITHPPVGVYVCNFSGCNAPPFQTQYLLNSHANVHSSVRPHYCPVKDCPRSEGGKGFKRKNEMIRHGLVHDSPGYVCPFCPDREHKYPRPDNLQRHVRVHHIDKEKDDPKLRDVLSQRPDGPSRGRRRRAVPS